MAGQRKGAWSPIVPVPEGTPDPKSYSHYARGEAKGIYTYRDREGRLLGYRCLYFDSKKRPVTHALTWCFNAEAKEYAWRNVEFPRLKPLYGLDRLPESGLVLLVFDEASADAAKRLITSDTTLAIAGGAKAVKDFDFSVLRGFFVSILAHRGHLATAQRAAKLLAEYQERPIAVMEPEAERPEGWSLVQMVDEGWTPEQASAWLEARREHAIKNPAPPADAQDEPPGANASDDRPVIRWREGKLPEIIDAAEEVLLNSGLPIFQRPSTGTIVRVVRREAHTVREYKRPPGSLGMVTVTPPNLLDTLTRHARWEKWDGRLNEGEGGFKPMNAHKDVASQYLARVGQWRLPVLDNTISVPTLRPDGTVLQAKGYDPATRLYYDPMGVKFPKIPERPTREEAETALELLKHAFRTLPFETEVDRSVAISAALTVLIRRSLVTAPLVGVTAPKARTGKSLIGEAIAILAMGTAPPTMSWPVKEDEAKKAALATLLDAPPMVMIDNVEHPLYGDWFCSVLTSEVWTNRQLGVNENVTVPTKVLWIATGNNLEIAGDLHARSLVCRINAKMENPELRQFSGSLQAEFMRQRGELVAAGLTVMRAFIAQGERPAELIAPWGGFDEWSALVRAPLVWLGMPDPRESAGAIAKKDPLRRLHVHMLEAWVECFGSKPATARDAIRIAEEVRNPVGTVKDCEKLMEELLTDVGTSARSGKLEPRTLGKWIEAHADSPVRGEFGPQKKTETRQFEAAGERSGSTLWKVVTVSTS